MAYKRNPRAASQCEIKPWLSANSDSREGRYIQVGNSLLLSPKFQELTTGARQLYACMCMEAGKHRQLIFPKSAAKKYGFHYSTFKRLVKELEDNGFITCDRAGATREANKYELSLSWKSKPLA